MRYILPILLLTSCSASAQQQTPNEQALGQKLLQEMTASVGCSSQLIQAQRDLETAKAELIKLKEKSDAK